jgi:hypothetical protein
MKVYSESQAKKLKGLIEVISDKAYTLSAAKRRCAGGIPRDITPGGEPIVIGPLETGNQKHKRYQACWYVRKSE